MKRAVLLLCIIALFAGAEFANGNRWLNESIGEWSFVWVEKTGTRREVFKGSRKIWRLQDGTYRIKDTFRLQGQDTYVSEVWEYPDGRLKTVDYANGDLYGSGEGSWKMRGRKMNWFTTFDSKDGSFTYSGNTRRINRNLWVTKATMNPGNVKISITKKRALKNKR